MVANPTGSGTFTISGSTVTSTTAGVSTSRSVVATAQPGYKFSSWSVSGNATGTASSNTYTLKTTGASGTGTLTGNFVKTYAFVEGRFRVYNSTRSTITTTYGSSGQWNESSTNIPMDYDEENEKILLFLEYIMAKHGFG